MDPPLDREAVAKLLKISKTTVDRYRKSGKLRCSQFVKRGRVLFLPESVAECLRELESKPAVGEPQ
jgi:predicted site-specific integrase-resolvase